VFAIDTNLLVYAHNEASDFNESATAFIEDVMNERDNYGNIVVGIPAQVMMEFVNVITRQNLEKPLSFSEAIQVVQDYLDTGITIINHRETQTQTFVELLRSITTRKKVFDVALAATLKDNGISGLYAANVSDFEEFGFLQVVNPL